jgi:hypothetical protein
MSISSARFSIERAITYSEVDDRTSRERSIRLYLFAAG